MKQREYLQSNPYGIFKTNVTTSYKLAEKLSERLDDMGKDLTSMIEEVNGASSTLTKTNKADEPVCHKPILYVLRELLY